MSELTSNLRITGLRENNLKNVTLSIPHNRFVTVTGLSGSGKSTLAVDTLYAEGGRRYIETFSPYTRQFLDRLSRPDFDVMTGVRPALALEQRNRVSGSRSTVGTATELNDYLKIVFSQLAVLICPSCETTVERDHPARVLQQLLAVAGAGASITLSFPLPLSGVASRDGLVDTLTAEGFIRYLPSPTAEPKRLSELSEEELSNGQEFLVVVDRIRLGRNDQGEATATAKERLLSTINQAFTYGHGSLLATVSGATTSGGVAATGSPSSPPVPYRFHEDLRCPGCGAVYHPAKPHLFSFNSPLGACKGCNGFGSVLAIDEEKVVPDPRLSIADGVISCWNSPSTAGQFKKLRAYCERADIELRTPWLELPKSARQKILNGEKGEQKWRGVRGWFDTLLHKRHKMHVRVFLARYRSESPCPDCHGTRLTPPALQFKVEGHSLPDFWALPVTGLLPIFERLCAAYSGEGGCAIALEEIVSRVKYLLQVGLGYLTLDRQMKTLSGGESQRVGLTSILGSRLVHTLLVLDEPTVGLHPRDTKRLIDTLLELRDRGNTLVVVEHDPDVIAASDHVVDIGPLSGAGGGEIVFEGPPSELLTCERSLTGRFLSQVAKVPAAASALPYSKKSRPVAGKKTTKGGGTAGALVVHGARAHNLKNIDVEIPLGRLVVLTGVSGSGKSSLIHQCIYENYKRIHNGTPVELLAASSEAVLTGIAGLEQISDVVLIDQSPVGKTPRSNPGTYTGVWDIIRECLADTPSAQAIGLGKSAFSFNVDGGRCPVCKGAGQERIEMQFLADVFVECEACGGTRFQDKILTVTLGGKNVIELLQLTLDETAALFRSLTDEPRAGKVVEGLRPLLELGLGYLRLGQPLNELSGGEAQRLKLASYLLSSPEEKRSNAHEHILFILDEPTTGLHPHNITQLLYTLRALIESGHSVLCVEHNLDFIANGDWLIDLGPEGGAAGGYIIAEGTVEQFLTENFAGRSETALALRRTFTSRKPRVTASGASASPCPVTVDHENDPIQIDGAREHNLKEVSVEIPKNRIVAVTGVSGSGKSTLAFDILFAEGQRRYIECLSPYARQYIKQLRRADVNRVHALPPTIAVSQKTAPPMGVSTIATTTELYQYLRLLFSKVGRQHCPHDDTPITSFSSTAVLDELAERFPKDRLFLFAPVVAGRKGFYNDLFARAVRADIHEARIDGTVRPIAADLRLERHKLHWISLLVGSVSNARANRELVREAIEHALVLGGGTLEISVKDKNAEPILFSTSRVCPTCKRGFRELDPQDFSFRSARGVCEKCGGRGRLERSGSPLCPACKGERIAALGRHVYIDGKNIHQFAALTAPALLAELRSVRFSPRLLPVVEPILRELESRLEVICAVGIDYLSLDRDASSISGGEAQRLRLARCLGSPLSGVCYVLDEPSIGLHPEDLGQLLRTLYYLRDAGNTVVIVEHDEETIRAADHVIDIGPGGGTAGGSLVYEGPVAGLEGCEHSATGAALRARSFIRAEGYGMEHARTAAEAPREWLQLEGATTNNLKSVSCELPVGCLTTVVGVSGAGKSSLVHGSLVPALLERLTGSLPEEVSGRTWKKLRGGATLERLYVIDQSPVGKTPTSSPASFLGIFDDIRKIYAGLPEAKARGWSPSFFSFNTGKGRCPECGGRGYIKVPMSFLPDAITECEACSGDRYTAEALEITYQGLTISELLRRTIAEAKEILSNHSAVRRSLEAACGLGIGYLTLGQATHTLSGGEAQRLKIAKELGLREAVNTLYVFDEPTTGLHMSDVDKLLSTLRSLVTKGNTVVVIEHNLDIVRGSDYIVELGPKPGDAGGEVVFSGWLHAFLGLRTPTPTSRHLLGTPSAEVRPAAKSARVVSKSPKKSPTSLSTTIERTVARRAGASGDATRSSGVDRKTAARGTSKKKVAPEPSSKVKTRSVREVRG